MNKTIADILSPERTIINAPGSSKKRLMDFLSERIFHYIQNSSPMEISTELMKREQLGSTALGHGIAIPHCRLSQCLSSLGLFARLEQPIDFNATDKKPVDLLFVLIVPEKSCQEHLEILAMVVEKMKEKQLVQQLRQAQTSNELYRLMIAAYHRKK